MKISSPTANFRNPENATASCLSGIFRRLLCRNLATVQSSGDFEDFSRTGSSPPREEIEERKEKTFEAEIAAPSPNIVARLMGLESMPEFDWMPRTPDSIGRSRSANSLHRWIDSDPIQQKNHRRVKTSSSFREIPTFLRQENEDFLLLSFELDLKERPKTDWSIREVQESKRYSGTQKEKERRRDEKKKSKESDEEVHQKKKKSDEEIDYGRKKVSERRANPSTGEDNGREFKRKQNRARRSEVHILVQQGESSPSSPNRSKVGIRKGKIDISVEKKSESESSSENSSPVSVLDRPFEAATDFLASEQGWRQKAVEPRIKVSSSKPNSAPLPNSITGRDLKTEQKKGEDPEVQNDSRTWMGILIIPEADIVRDMNWVSRDWWKAGETGDEIGLQILDSLLLDLVAELSGPDF